METLSDDWDDRTIVGYPRIHHYYPIVIENKFSSTWTPLKSKKILQKCSSKIFHLLKLCWIFVKRTYLRVSWRSTIDLCLMNLPKRSLSKVCWKFTPWVKFYFGLLRPSYFSLENACYSWCMHQTGLFSSASVVPQSKFTGELWSSASVVPQIKTELCS